MHIRIYMYISLLNVCLIFAVDVLLRYFDFQDTLHTFHRDRACCSMCCLTAVLWKAQHSSV